MTFNPDELRGVHGRWSKGGGGRHRAVNRISVRQTEKRKPAVVAERPRQTESQASKRYQASVEAIRSAHSAFARRQRGEKLSRKDTSLVTKYVEGPSHSPAKYDFREVPISTSREAAVDQRREVQRPISTRAPRVQAKRSGNGKAYVVRRWDMTHEDAEGQFHFHGRRTRVANLGGKKGSSKRSTVRRARDLMRKDQP